NYTSKTNNNKASITNNSNASEVVILVGYISRSYSPIFYKTYIVDL
ncbi:9387_t:CDS:2, partial [Scutellospora calospora]